MSLVSSVNHYSTAQLPTGSVALKQPGQEELSKPNNLLESIHNAALTNKFQSARDFHQPPFASVVQVPIRQILAEKTTQEKKEESAASKHRKEMFTLIAPILMLVGGLSWLGKALPTGIKQSLFSKLFKANGSKDIIDNGLERTGNLAIGFGDAFLAVNGILSGLISGQSTMVIGQLLQFIPAVILVFFAKNKESALRNIAVNMGLITGSMFTVGFANEIRNKDKNTPASQIQKYNMERFKSLISPQTKITSSNRITGIAQELGHITSAAIQDHVQLFKKLPEDLNQVSYALTHWNTINNNRLGFKDWVSKPSADKSNLAALLMYAGALPVLLFSKKAPHIANSKIAEVIKGAGLLLANLSLFSIALNRHDIRGKAPLLGVPMVVAGMAGKTPIMHGLGNVGESIDNLFYSDIAVNGLNTSDSKESNLGNLNPTVVSSNTNPFDKIRLTK